MPASSVVIVPIAWVRMSAISSSVRMMKSSSCPGTILWRVRSSTAIASAVELVWPADAAETVMFWMKVTPSSFFWTVVYGTRI